MRRRIAGIAKIRKIDKNKITSPHFKNNPKKNVLLVLIKIINRLLKTKIKNHSPYLIQLSPSNS